MDNDQDTTYIKDSTNSILCAVTAAFRVVTREKLLKVESGNSIAVYVAHHSSDVKCQYVDDTHINFLLEEVTKALYKFTSKVDVFTSNLPSEIYDRLNLW